MPTTNGTPSSYVRCCAGATYAVAIAAEANDGGDMKTRRGNNLVNVTQLSSLVRVQQLFLIRQSLQHALAGAASRD